MISRASRNARVNNMSDHGWVNEASGAENEPMPSEAKDFGPFYHGTKADLNPGGLAGTWL